MSKIIKFPVWVGDTVYKICPKCNDKHNGSCKNCAWSDAIQSYGCDIGPEMYPDGSGLDKTMQIVKKEVTEQNLFTICELFGIQYFESIKDAKEAMNEFARIRDIQDKDERIRQFNEFTEETHVDIEEYPPKGKWHMYSYDEAICTCCGYDRSTPFESTSEAKEHWDELPKYCEACGALLNEKGDDDEEMS